jgi:hypothetical protein
MTKAPLHTGTDGRVKQLAWLAEYFVDNGRNFGVLMVES